VTALDPREPAAPEPLVLVVEDEPQLVRLLRATLPPHGYRMVDASTAAQALVEASTRAPDLVLLDLGLPDLDGVEVVRRIREWSRMPIVVVSARGQERDKVEALDAGADDYLTKPFGTSELLARMRVALRHAARVDGSNERVLEAGDLRIDLAARIVYRRGEEVRLTRTEYLLVAALAHHAGKVLTHRQLLREVWGPNAVGDTQYLRVYMAQLRHKLEDDPARPRHLLTETGVGYRFKVDA
jgi:two-component system KDP operon response regulator KdpE